MKSSRTYFSVFLAIAILCVSYYLSQAFFFGKKDSAPAQISKIYSSGNTPKFAESLSGSGSSTKNLTQELSEDFSAEFYTNIQGLDEEARNDLFEQIKSGDVSGLDLGNVDPDQIAQQLTPDLIGIKSEVSDDEFVIDERNSLEAYARRYELALTDVRNFVSGQSADEAVEKLLNDGDASGIDALIKAMRETAVSLQSIPVPAAARDFHKKNILFFENSATVYAAIGNYDTDPIRAYIATQYMTQLAQDWGEIAKELVS